MVLTCDADVDGAHIRTLILTFLFRQMKELIEAGYVYIAQPPLYRLKMGSDARYFEKDFQLEEWLIRERLEKIQVHDRGGDELRLTEARLQRFQRVAAGVRGLGRQAARAVRVGAGDVRQGPPADRARDRNASMHLAAYLSSEVPEDEPHRVEVVEPRGRRPAGQDHRTHDRLLAHGQVPGASCSRARATAACGLRMPSW